MTRWGRTIHQVVQGKSGGGTCSGSCWMSLSVTHLFWNVSPSMPPYLPDLDGPCSSSSLNWLSNWLEAFVAGSDTLERRGSVSPKPMQLLCTTYLVIKKWSFRDEKKPASTAPIMDERHHVDVPLRPPMVATGVEWTCAATVASYSITQKIAICKHKYATLISKI